MKRIFFFIQLTLLFSCAENYNVFKSSINIGEHLIFYSVETNSNKILKNQREDFFTKIIEYLILDENRVLNKTKKISKNEIAQLEYFLNDIILNKIFEPYNKWEYHLNRNNLKEISVKIENSSSLNATASYYNKTINIPIGLIRKSLLLSLNNSVNQLKLISENCITDELNIKKLEDSFFYLYNLKGYINYDWNYNFDNPKKLKPKKYQKEIYKAIELDVVLDFAYNDFKKYLVFFISHELYHILTKNMRGIEYENEADDFASFIMLYSFRLTDYFNTRSGTIITRKLISEQENDSLCNRQKSLFQYGVLTKNVLNNIYSNTIFENGSTHYLPIKNRKNRIRGLPTKDTREKLKTKIYEIFKKRNISNYLN